MFNGVVFVVGSRSEDGIPAGDWMFRIVEHLTNVHSRERAVYAKQVERDGVSCREWTEAEAHAY